MRQDVNCWFGPPVCHSSSSHLAFVFMNLPLLKAALMLLVLCVCLLRELLCYRFMVVAFPTPGNVCVQI